MNIVAVMTIYNPDLELLERNIKVLSELSILTMLYDNTPGNLYHQNEEWASHAKKNGLKIEYKGVGSNDGLSIAYNSCIQDQIDNDDVEAFLLLDQDTDLEKSNPLSLVQAYHVAKTCTDLGVIGGKPIRPNGDSYRYKAKSKNKVCGKFLDALLVISSFSIIPKTAFLKAGLFQVDFFIDHIDYDFCWQCHRKGLATLIDESSTFTHSVGKGDVRIFGKQICPISAPFRGYYQVRNTILSAKRGGAPLHWTLKELTKRFIVVSLNGLADRNVLTRFSYAFKGLVHGFSGRGGKLTE